MSTAKKRKKSTGKHRERAKRLRAGMKRIQKISGENIKHNIISSDQYVDVIRYSGIDVKYRTKSGKIKTVKLYKPKSDKSKATFIGDLSYDERTAIHDALNRIYLMREAQLAYLESKTPRQRKSLEIEDMDLDNTMKLLENYNIDVDPDNLEVESVENAGVEVWDPKDSDQLNLFYHVFGATRLNLISLNAFRIWKVREGWD